MKAILFDARSLERVTEEFNTWSADSHGISILFTELLVSFPEVDTPLYELFVIYKQKGSTGISYEYTGVKPVCRVCAVDLTIRFRREDGQKFWGCSNYPGCTETMPFTDDHALYYTERKKEKTSVLPKRKPPRVMNSQLSSDDEDIPF